MVLYKIDARRGFVACPLFKFFLTGLASFLGVSKTYRHPPKMTSGDKRNIESRPSRKSFSALLKNEGLSLTLVTYAGTLSLLGG